MEHKDILREFSEETRQRSIASYYEYCEQNQMDWTTHARKKNVLPPATGNPVTARAIAFFKQQPQAQLDQTPFVYELGCGGGTDTWPYLQEGYKVHAIDANKVALEVLNDRFAEKYAGKLTTEQVTLQTMTLNKADIVSCVSVFRCLPREDFCQVWPIVVNAIKPGGILSCDIYGVEHSWYKKYPGQTYLTLDEIQSLFAASQLTIIDKTEYKQSVEMVLSDPVFFHYHEIVAQKRTDEESSSPVIDEVQTRKILGM